MQRVTATGGLVLHDGHAGNRRQAFALADALGLASRECTLQAREPWASVAPRLLPGAGKAFGNEFAAELEQPPALAIGCGRQAALATRLLGERGSKTVQILDPRIDTQHWDVVVAPEHDALRGDNVVGLLGSLHPVDDAWLVDATARFNKLAALPEPRTALLLGGDGKHWRFDHATFEFLAMQVETALRREGGGLMVTASRRTPAGIVEALQARFARLPNILWRDERDGAAFDGHNPYAGMLAWADRIVCTPDSVNMISEACATRAPVHVFDVARVEGRVRAFLDSLLQRGRIREFDASLAPFAATPLRETPRVAAEVKRRLGL